MIRDRIWAVFFIVVGALLYARTYTFIPASAKFPRMLIVGIIILSVFLFINDKKKETSDDAVWPPIITFLISVGYAILVYLISFFPATAVFLPVLMYYMGSRDWKTILLTTVGVEIFIYFVFVMQLEVYMPRGLLF